MTDWAELATELAAWERAGRRATLWWRDDDAGAVTPALRRLLSLAAQHAVPLALAAIPEMATPALAAAVVGQPRLTVLQHGLAHRNHAADGAKKAEFGADRPHAVALAEIEAGRRRLAELFDAPLLPVFVPPWNRIDPALVPLLPQAVIAGLSRFSARTAQYPAAGVLEVNCHLDPVAWRGDRGFIGESAALAAVVQHLRDRRAGVVDAGEPTGLLTHHAVCNEAGWAFLDRLLAFLARQNACYWLSAADIFRLAP